MGQSVTFSTSSCLHEAIKVHFLKLSLSFWMGHIPLHWTKEFQDKIRGRACPHPHIQNLHSGFLMWPYLIVSPFSLGCNLAYTWPHLIVSFFLYLSMCIHHHPFYLQLFPLLPFFFLVFLCFFWPNLISNHYPKISLCLPFSMKPYHNLLIVSDWVPSPFFPAWIAQAVRE